MSLDVYLKLPGTQGAKGERIFVRQGGQNREVTREEWDLLFPGQEPFTAEIDDGDDVYTANITHNLNEMADAAGIYQELWRPEELGITRGEQLIEPLRAGLARLRAEPEQFRVHNPSNGWGTYEALVAFVEGYLAACEQWPTSEVSVWR